MSFEGKTPRVFELNGAVYANSRDVAASFAKRNADVNRAIRDLVANLPGEFSRRNFTPNKISDLTGESVADYDMTRDGFTLLAMGFTGARALEFKLRYIEAFNRMEAMLKSGGFDAAALESLVTKTVGAAMTAAMAGLKGMVSEIVEQAVTAKMVADPRAAVMDYLAPLDIAKKHGVPARGRRRFTKSIGDRLAQVCAAWEVPVKLCSVTGRRMFPTHAVDYWLATGGKAMIAGHIAQAAGQGVLPFRKKGA